MHLVHQLIFHENRSQQVGNSTAKRPQIMFCWWWWWWCVWVIFKHSFHLFSVSSGWLGATLCVVIRRDFLAMHHCSFEDTVCAPPDHRQRFNALHAIVSSLHGAGECRCTTSGATYVTDARMFRLPKKCEKFKVVSCFTPDWFSSKTVTCFCCCFLWCDANRRIGWRAKQQVIR